MKTKLFMLLGSGTESLRITNSQYSLFDSDNLSPYTEQIMIGDVHKGFTIDDLKTQFALHLTDNSEPINILLCAHSDYEEDEYLIEINLETDIECGELISTLVSSTNGSPLKMLAVCCNGANFHKHLKLFSSKLTLITLSDINRETNSYDFQTINAQKLLKIFLEENFTIERLFEAYLFSQRYTTNTPILSIIDENSSLTLSISDIIKDYFKTNNFEHSTRIANLKAAGIITDEQINIVTKSLSSHNGETKHLIMQDIMLPQLIECWMQNKLEDFIQTHENQYYFPGSLQTLKLDAGSFDADSLPEISADLREANLRKFIILHHYGIQKNTIENRLVCEYKTLLFKSALTYEERETFVELSQNTVIKFYTHHTTLCLTLNLDNEYSILMFDKENFKFQNEFAHHDSNTDRVIDYNLPVNNILPQYSVCMGLAFDAWLQDHS